MRTRTDESHGIRVLACLGALTVDDGADELDGAFLRALHTATRGIVLDLTRTSYLDSAGIGAVVSCSKQAAAAGIVMKVALSASGPVRRIFELTQLERGFEIFEDAGIGRGELHVGMSDFVNSKKNPPPKSAFDSLLRRFARISYHLFVVLVVVIAASAMGLALAPALWVWHTAQAFSLSLPVVPRYLVSGLSLAASFFVFGFALLLIVPVYNFVLPTRVQPFKGGYYTIHAVPWALHNVLFYLVRYTFLPFVTLTPFGIWFLKAMGMTIGRHAFVNTELISDPCLITLGDDVTLGGSVRIFAHYGGGGNLVIAPVVIDDRATVGIGVTIMGDVRVGKGAVILPHSALLPGSRVGDGETWGGIPARPIPREEMERIKASIR